MDAKTRRTGKRLIFTATSAFLFLFGGLFKKEELIKTPPHLDLEGLAAHADVVSNPAGGGGSSCGGDTCDGPSGGCGEG